ncbi:hypothetical protein [Jiangella asiatica]|uniref:Uncharacterized protein n=1 Tax=Jiangella asiatica TaxID=2530372 RepID=A0A4R5DA96_9ACTN|nr:hypothetical protein [Jiangella asiatica]TDE07485.1 hypothetical protein E1269_19825 [Jiangella asiatica]
MEPLGLPDLADALRGREAWDKAYELVVGFVHENEMVVQPRPDDVSVSELPWRIPGTSLTVRIKGSSTEDLQIFGVTLALLFGLDLPDISASTVPGVLARDAASSAAQGAIR